MPIYEYLCKNCGALVEVMQKISDPAPGKCEKCQAGPLEKQMSMTSFALKGTGWYVTDFRGGSDKKTTPSNSSSPASNPQAASEPKATDTPVKPASTESSSLK